MGVRLWQVKALSVLLNQELIKQFLVSILAILVLASKRC